MELNNPIINYLPLIIVLLPLLAGLTLYLKGAGGPALVTGMVLGSTILPLLLAAAFYPKIAAGVFPGLLLDVLPPVGLSFRIDYLGYFLLLLFVAAGLIISVYSLQYMAGSDPLRHRFFAFKLMVLAGCYGVAMAGDFFTFYLFFEFMSLMFFVLIAHRQTREAITAAYKFLLATIVAGVTLFLAVAIIYWETGSLAFTGNNIETGQPTLMLIAFIGFVLAFGIKSAIFPLHLWMPDAYSEAPLPAATLSSVIMLKTGAYGLIRVFGGVYGISYLQEVNWAYPLVIIAAFTILFGSVTALAQEDLVRRLAYSGIAQLGYIILGLAILEKTAFIGASYHILAHAFMKGALFLCAGLMINAAGSRKIDDLKGIALRLPLTMICFATATLTAVGMPPFNIFISKWHLGLGALEIEALSLLIILLVSSMLNAAYYLPIVTRAFLGLENQETGTNYKKRTGKVLNGKPKAPLLSEAPAALLVPVLLLTLGCVVFGLMPQNLPLEMIKEGLGPYF